MINLIYFFCEFFSTLIEDIIIYESIKKFKTDKKLKLSDIFFILFMISITLTINYSVAKFSALNLIAGILLWFIWLIFNSNTRILRTKFLHLLLPFILLNLCDSFSFFSAQYLLKISYLSLLGNTLQRLSTMFLSKILLVITYKFIFNVDLKCLANNWKRFLYTSVIFIFYLIMQFSSIYNLFCINSNSKTLIYDYALNFLIANFLMFGFLVFLISYCNKQERIDMIETNYALQKMIINEQKMNIKTIRKIQHEYKNNLDTINALLINEEFDKAKELFNKILDISNITSTIIKSSSFFDIIINYKLICLTHTKTIPNK